ncbi:MAG: phage terminase large subunit [Bacteroidales bacterium]|nr:phage terminase large subunit [Bacteroidales bacterium]
MPVKTIRHTDILGPAYFQALNDFLRGWYIDPEFGKLDLREQVFSGGRGSLKSSTISILIILGLERDAREADALRKMGDPRWRSHLTHAVCFRKIGSDLATSVFAQMEWAITKLGLEDEYVLTKSPLRILRRKSGQVIYFRGLDDPTKVKSIRAPGLGFFKYLWAEELDQFDGMEEIRSVRQSVLRGGHKFQTFYSYNPPETTANWVNYEMALHTPGRKVYRTNYLSVPKEWLGENFFIEAEITRRQNERAYRHEYLGEITGNGGSVFPNLVEREITDEELSRYDRLCLGLDFGFSLDPSAFSASYYDQNHNRLIVFDEIYQTNLRNVELAEMIKAKPYVGYNYIMCDSAEPKSIADLEAFGINALPVVKTERRFGFKWLQSLNEIVVSQRRTPNAYRELSQAEYRKTASGQFISDYPKVNDHFLDSLRYACSELSSGTSLF